MNKVVFAVSAVVLLFGVGEALRCYKCDVGFWNLCVTSIINCTGSTDQCFSGIGKAAGFVDINQKGCLPGASCNLVSNVTFAGTSLYTMNKTCCATDLCNGAGAPGLSALSAVAVATAWLAAGLV
ncbi:prostate stem cell antigen-like [Lepisosteus oculatus]|uniref:prostate stem cell antigen-like n=1 Tax=Lepisosteus oculatus TaxID=7918 RepID=UPI0035F4FF80